MMTVKDEALKLALEALEKSIAVTMADIDLRHKAISTIKQALAAQPAVPLTEPALRAVLEKTNHMIANTMRGPFWPELEQACRAIEAAHGITAKPEKGQP